MHACIVAFAHVSKMHANNPIVSARARARARTHTHTHTHTHIHIYTKIYIYIHVCMCVCVCVCVYKDARCDLQRAREKALRCRTQCTIAASKVYKVPSPLCSLLLLLSVLAISKARNEEKVFRGIPPYVVKMCIFHEPVFLPHTMSSSVQSV